MYAPELSADQVLQAFRHDAPSLLFGAIILAVRLVSAAFPAVRRKYDRLLIYLGLLACSTACACGCNRSFCI